MIFDLSICIVNWNTGGLLGACVESIFRSTKHIQFEIIIVDNNSTDGSIDNLEQVYHHHPQIEIVRLEDNIGFAAANNIAIKIASSRYIVLLNPDTIVHDNAFDHAITFMDEHPQCGAMGPKLLNSDGSIQHSIGNFPTLAGFFWDTTRLGRFFPHIGFFSGFKRHDINYDEMQSVDQPMGACLFVRSTVIDQIGTLDERYFMYYEEVDWCYRIKDAEWEIYYVPQIEITHLGGQSSTKNLDARIVENARSRLLFIDKHHPNNMVFRLSIRAITLLEVLARTLVTIAAMAMRRQSREVAMQNLMRYAKVFNLTVRRHLYT